MKIDVDYLIQFEEFRAFREHSPKIESNGFDSDAKVSQETPQEIMDRSYQVIQESLAEELLERIMSQSPAFFESLVVELLVKMGYGGSISEAGKAIGKSGDEGIDGIIKEDKLGLDIIYIQAKRWKPDSSVGRPKIHKFIGALAGQGAKKGIFITTASFTKDALEFQPKKVFISCTDKVKNGIQRFFYAALLNKVSYAGVKLSHRTGGTFPPL